MKKMILDYIKNYRFRSVFLKYLILMLLIIFVPISIFASLYWHNYNQAIKYEISNTCETTLEKVNYILDAMMQSASRNGLILANHSEVRKFMFAEKVNDFTYNHRHIGAMFDTIKNSVEAIDSIYILSEKTGYIFSDTTGNYTDEFFDSDWISEYEKKKNEGQWFLKRSFFSVQENQQKQYLSVFQNVKYYNETYGTVVINIDIDFIKNNYLSTANKMSWAVFDLENHFQLSVGDIELDTAMIQNETYTQEHPNSQIIKLDGAERVVSGIQSPYTGWNILVATDTGFLSENRFYLEILNILLLIYGVVIAIIFFRWIMNPILRILSIFKPSDAMLGAYIEGNPENEIVFIMKNIAGHIEKSDLMEKEAQARLENLKAAQFAALQAQINPHFLANTLFGLYWFSLEKMGGPNEVSSAISALSDLVYLTTSKKGHFWNIETELLHLEKFIKIQKFRFGNDISVEMSVDPSLYTYKIIRLILQPVVENAFEHGVSSDTGGIISITGEEQKDDIVFRVFDNGSGMSAESIKGIAYVETEVEKYDPKHGLKNVNYRIKLLFGQRYGVEVETPETGGTMIIIRLPKI